PGVRSTSESFKFKNDRSPGNTPVFLMNSFATDSDTRAHVAEMGIDVPLHYVHQNISLRLRPDGEIYRDSKGAPSFYAPGHGDVFPALQRSAEFREWAKAGGKAVMVSNVDNLAATLDPLVVGAYLECGKRCMVEVAPKWDGDAGGAPAEVNGRVEIVEGFRFPPDFDQDSIPVFNTNTMWFDASVFLEDAPLQWYRADKKVGGDPVVQFERLMGERTSSLDSAYLEVPRDGAQGRFMPVKAPADLDTLRPEIKARLGA
ncbi:MAG: UTP--glucose-1-phosphate uridylyltransferase, partial [Myxococcota bacterium]